MKIKTRDWYIFFFLAILSLGFWYNLEYPRFSFIDLPINKQQALSEANQYLKNKGVSTENYAKAIVFESDEGFNRYFQHVAGRKAEEEFVIRHDFDLFYWLVRFFKESQKEEYILSLSPRTGKVVRFRHLIEDVESRVDLGKDIAKQKAEAFLEEAFGLALRGYSFHEERVKRYENRLEYVFSWEKKDIYIPWKEGPGGGKLLAEVTISGNEVREFSKNKFDLPEGFLRYVQKQFVLGEYLYNVFYVLLFVLLAWSITIVLKKRQDIVPRITKSWFYYLAVFLVIINTAGFFNNLQNIFMRYPTSAHLSSFLGLNFTKWVFNIGFLAIGFIIPGIAGESLQAEVLPENKNSSFFTFIKSGFLNRNLTGAILLGYLIWAIMLGMQAVIFYNGQKFLGVWREWHTMTYFSSSNIPLFGAFVIGISASFNEEVIFRLFGISLVKKYMRSLILAILLTSLIWGMGHTMYAIFPAWFRVVEITLIGIFYGVVFIRFGVIPLIVAHYLFDVFWCSAAYLLGHNRGGLFYSAIGLLALPVILAFVAYFLNHLQPDKPIREILNKTQRYNLDVLTVFVSARKSQGYQAELIKKELVDNGWDYLLVKLAVEAVFEGKI